MKTIKLLFISLCLVTLSGFALGKVFSGVPVDSVVNYKSQAGKLNVDLNTFVTAKIYAATKSYSVVSKDSVNAWKVQAGKRNTDLNTYLTALIYESLSKNKPLTLQDVVTNGNILTNSPSNYLATSVNGLTNILVNNNSLMTTSQLNDATTFTSLTPDLYNLNSTDGINNSYFSFSPTSVDITSKSLTYNGYKVLYDYGWRSAGTSTLSVTNTTVETIVKTFTINENQVVSGDVMDFQMIASKTGTVSTTQFKIYINSTPDLSGSPVQIAYFAGTSSEKICPFYRRFWYDGVNLGSYPATTSSQGDLGSTSTSPTYSPVDFTTTKYLIVTFKPTTVSAEVNKLEMFTFSKL